MTGSTNNPERRAAEHFGDGYRGLMYCAHTDNMMLRENAFLRSKRWPENTHQRSNSQEDDGYVYIIVGQKY